MRTTKHQRESIEYLQEWARAGFPKRVDGSFPTDFLTAVRRLIDVPPEQVSSRDLEELLVAGPDLDYKLGSDRALHWYRRGRELMGVTSDE